MVDVAGVYVIDLATGSYVGSSKHVRRRLCRHIADLKARRHSNPFLQGAYERHGIIACRTLLVCREEDLLTYEQRAIDTLNPRFNLSPTAGRNLGHRHSAETIERMKASGAKAWERRARVVPVEQRERISAALVGRVFSDETRAKISAAKKGKPHTMDARARMSAARKGKGTASGRKRDHRGRFIVGDPTMPPITLYEGREPRTH